MEGGGGGWRRVEGGGWRAAGVDVKRVCERTGVGSWGGKLGWEGVVRW